MVRGHQLIQCLEVLKLTHGVILPQDMNTQKLVFLLLLVLVSSRRHLNRQNYQVVEPVDVQTVLESNHFFSETERETTEKLNNLVKNEALIFMLKDTDGKKDSSLAENPIKISFESNGEKSECTFNTVHNMCALKNVQEESIEVKIACRTTPCELSWVIVQPKTVQNDGMHNINELVQINKDYNHAMMFAICSDPNVSGLQDKLKLFTNSKYQMVSKPGVQYYLFDSEQKGYYFLTTEDEGVKACINMTIKHNPDQIKFNQKEVTVLDYVLPQKTNIYDIPEVPQTDFRVDAFYHFAKQMLLNQKSSLQVSLIGESGSSRTKLQTITIPGREAGSIDFSIVFKKPTSSYNKLALDITNKGEEIIMINMQFNSGERQEVNLGETSYFHLRTGEVINFKLIPQSGDTPQSQKTHIFSSDSAKFVPSLTFCKAKVGCQFTLEAKEEGEGNLYFGEGEKQNTTEVISYDFTKSYSKKLREGEFVLLKRSIKAKKAFQAVVNSPNVLIYASSKQKCPQISPQCHEKVLNSHNPFIYEPTKDDDLYFLVHALDNCEFTLTIIDEGTEYVELEDTKPFTYLFDDSQREMKFAFKLKEKEDVNFNLIGPVNELNLIVLNEEKWNEDNRGEGQASTQGYLSFKKEDIESLYFVVKVEKREQFMKKYIHFTLLVSTKEGNVRLEPGISHFQTIKPEQTRDFVFQFEPKKQILLNIYTHNIKTQLQLNLKVSTTDEYDKEDDYISFDVDSTEDVLDLKDVSQELCKDEMAENCELFVRMENKMGIELDVTLTLMIRDSIIELKDGVWNSFKETEVSKTSHFYFLPKHPNKSVTILYRADYVDLKIMYTIWKTDDKSISPAEWPFPTSIKNSPEDATSPFLAIRPTKYIHVDSQALKECWMNCVVLVTVFEDKSGPKSRFGLFTMNRTFKIMGSNNFVEIPEKHKVDIILKAEEQKHLLVDLKYVLQKNALTFFTYYTLGTVTLTGNVYDQENPRCPTEDEAADFQFGRVQTQISVGTIKKKLQENSMSEDKHPYICILALAASDSKFSIEYDSNDEIINQLQLDSSYVHKGTANSAKIFQIDASQEFKLKITRSAGFPFIDQALCKSNEDLETCLNAFKEKTSKGEQMATLTKIVEEEPCEKCIFFLKITSEQQTEVNLHSQSKYAETELQEKRVLADEVSKDEINKYSITASRSQELNINIQITHGNITVTVNDFAGTFVTKSNEGQNHLLISVPPPNDSNNSNSAPLWGRVFFSAFAQSTLKSYHVEVKSQDGKTNAAYSITYSSGEVETFLQDGLIATHALLPNRTTKFLYSNPTLNKIYLHLTAPTTEALNKLHVRIISMANPNDEQSGVQITPEKANFNKKTPNPTRIMSLPGNKFYQISIANENTEVILVTLGINNQEVIYLPFNHQFPVQLRQNEYIYLVINSPFQAFMDVEIKKCGESSMAIAYTTDYQDFIKEEFQNEQELDHNQLTANIHLKTKMHGAVYLKLKSSPDEVTVLTVKASFSFAKTKVEKATAGGRGELTYQLLSSKTAQIEFEPLTCPSINKNCQKQFSYSSISAEKLEGVYAQLVCPSVAFELQDRQVLSEGKARPISVANKHNSNIYFEQNFSGDLDYVGVKATNNRTGEVVYYKPVQIVTFWGQVEKNRKGSSNILGGVLVVLVVCCILIVYRRRRKRELEQYVPLSAGAD